MAGRGKTATIQKAAKTALSAPERLRRVLVPIAFWTGVAKASEEDGVRFYFLGGFGF